MVHLRRLPVVVRMSRSNRKWAKDDKYKKHILQAYSPPFVLGRESSVAHIHLILMKRATTRRCAHESSADWAALLSASTRRRWNVARVRNAHDMRGAAMRPHKMVVMVVVGLLGHWSRTGSPHTIPTYTHFMGRWNYASLTVRACASRKQQEMCLYRVCGRFGGNNTQTPGRGSREGEHH